MALYDCRVTIQRSVGAKPTSMTGTKIIYWSKHIGVICLVSSQMFIVFEISGLNKLNVTVYA